MQRSIAALWRVARARGGRGWLLPGELAKHAVSEGTKAVTKFEAATNKK